MLAIAKKKFAIDESRVYLTGHSMGGHGTWHLGTLYPDKWAAIGPSAGWVSFWSYRVRGKVRMATPAAAMTFRGTHGSDTYRLAENLKPIGVYILHGADDDNVLAKESRSMAERLKGFHRDFIYYEQLGQNHWWDLSDEPGADCVDWAPMMDFFNHHRRPDPSQVRTVEFSTPHPGISSACSWLRIETQKAPAAISKVSLRFDPGTAALLRHDDECGTPVYRS
ncbi:MAG: prolyl oligopeptidase family serine peptidase [Ignavibacteria bacterium]|nr:prolyl oligopeptidase family serine peptidase [Ignavibacteria bacterium]